jgi:hypothetical protein
MNQVVTTKPIPQPARIALLFLAVLLLVPGFAFADLNHPGLSTRAGTAAFGRSALTTTRTPGMRGFLMRTGNRIQRAGERIGGHMVARGDGRLREGLDRQAEYGTGGGERTVGRVQMAVGHAIETSTARTGNAIRTAPETVRNGTLNAGNRFRGALSGARVRLRARVDHAVDRAHEIGGNIRQGIQDTREGLGASIAGTDVAHREVQRAPLRPTQYTGTAINIRERSDLPSTNHTYQTNVTTTHRVYGRVGGRVAVIGSTNADGVDHHNLANPNPQH